MMFLVFTSLFFMLCFCITGLLNYEIPKELKTVIEYKIHKILFKMSCFCLFICLILIIIFNI